MLFVFVLVCLVGPPLTMHWDGKGSNRTATIYCGIRHLVMTRSLLHPGTLSTNEVAECTFRLPRYLRTEIGVRLLFFFPIAKQQ